MKAKNYKQTKITKYFKKKHRKNDNLMLMIKNLNII